MPVETTGSTLVTDIGCLVGERNQSERCPRNAASCLRAQPTTFMEQPSNEPTGFANLQRRGCVHPRRLVSRSSLWSIVVCAVEREREREETNTNSLSGNKLQHQNFLTQQRSFCRSLNEPQRSKQAQQTPLSITLPTQRVPRKSLANAKGKHTTQQ
mmetsp:Transcript_6563/g.15634  ORF Transcript_6563/g.15634 Transcript_6563/m.15634 type:complete len:156 (-) Transcript_6563:2185-2652(-)